MLEARVEPRRIGRYTLLAKLASGGMATVFLAQSHGELGFQRLCAVKIIHPHLLDQPEFLARFLHEGKVAAGIRHPNVVAVLDVGQAGDTPYLVLDYVRGGSLAELMRRADDLGEPPSLEVACTIVREVLEGLHAVHTATDEQGAPLGLIHRDVSHDNILLSTDGVAYVTDLGIARARGVALTQATGLLGKAGYISPEQLAKEPLTNKVDLFAAGVVLWELLTQKRLFVDLEAELPMLTGTFELEPPSRSNPRVPAALDGLVARMLARRPDDRPRSAGAAAQELGRIIPAADRGEISEWVQSLAEPRLERLDAILRDAKQSVPPPPVASSTAGDTRFSSGAFESGASATFESGAHPRAGSLPPPKRGGGAARIVATVAALSLVGLGSAAAFRMGLAPRTSPSAPASPPSTSAVPRASAPVDPTVSVAPSVPPLPSATGLAPSAKPPPTRPTGGHVGAPRGQKPAAPPSASAPPSAPPPVVIGPAAERL